MSNHRRKEVSERIARIQGHVQGIAEMLAEGRSYSDVTHQISAVRSSLDRVVEVIVDDLMEDCVAEVKSGRRNAESLKELQAVVARLK